MFSQQEKKPVIAFFSREVCGNASCPYFLGGNGYVDSNINSDGVEIVKILRDDSDRPKSIRRITSYRVLRKCFSERTGYCLGDIRTRKAEELLISAAIEKAAILLKKQKDRRIPPVKYRRRGKDGRF